MTSPPSEPLGAGRSHPQNSGLPRSCSFLQAQLSCHLPDGVKWSLRVHAFLRVSGRKGFMLQFQHFLALQSGASYSTSFRSSSPNLESGYSKTSERHRLWLGFKKKKKYMCLRSGFPSETLKWRLHRGSFWRVLPKATPVQEWGLQDWLAGGYVAPWCSHGRALAGPTGNSGAQIAFGSCLQWRQCVGPLYTSSMHG